MSATATMTTKEVAQRMQALFNENKWEQVQEELYAEDAESIEPTNPFGMPSVRGRDAIKMKGEAFQNQVEEMHGGWVSDLIVAGNFITCGMGMDVTMKGAGRVSMDEICVYEVKDGKVVKEQFFY